MNGKGSRGWTGSLVNHAMRRCKWSAALLWAYLAPSNPRLARHLYDTNMDWQPNKGSHWTPHRKELALGFNIANTSRSPRGDLYSATNDIKFAIWNFVHRQAVGNPLYCVIVGLYILVQHTARESNWLIRLCIYISCDMLTLVLHEYSWSHRSTRSVQAFINQHYANCRSGMLYNEW